MSNGDESTRVVFGTPSQTSTALEPLPSELDRYAVHERIGVGGMGMVFAAHDPELDRTVALKVVRPPKRAGVDRETAQRALLREARAVAALSHPNVVTIFDVGRAGDRVYFAMEHIRGVTLAKWLGRGGHDWRGIVDVFVQAGRGLAAAHRAGLVHGDFKPNNVLIGEDERVVVVDFGLAHPHGSDSVTDDAHAVDPQSSGSAPAVVLGTPLFMAPESLLAGTTDAATDQFAFCVALWQALWRKHPFADDDDDPRAVLARVRAHRRGPPPARGAVPSGIRSALDRGLASDSSQRWPDMDMLLAALERARAPWRRLWIAVPIVAVLALAPLAVREDASDCDADEIAMDATWNDTRRVEIETSLAAVDRGYAPEVARRVGARLDDHAQRLRVALGESCVAAASAAEQGRRRRRACLHERRGALEALVAELAIADEKLLDRAIDAVATLPRPEGCDVVAVAGGAESDMDEDELALRPDLARMNALVSIGRVDAAIALGEARLVERREEGDGPATAALLDALGNAYEGAARLQDAERVWTEAVWIAQSYGRDDIVALAAISLVSSVGFQQSRPADGLDWARHAEAALARRGADDATRAGLHNALGLARVAAGDYAGAVAEYEHALGMIAERESLDRASVLNNLGPALLKQGRPTEARAVLEESLRIQEDARGKAHPELAGTLGNAGLAAEEQGDHDAALAYLERALAIGEAAYGPDHPTVAFFVNNIGVHHYDRGQFALALPMYLRVVAVLEKVYGEHPNTALALGNVGLVLVELGRADEALETHRRALQIATMTIGEDHPDFAMALNNMGSAQRELGRLDEARSSYERALELRERLLGRDHPLTATTVANLGLVAALAGDHALARERHARALAIWEAALGPDHARVGIALVGLGEAALALGELDEAERLLERAQTVAMTADGDPAQLAEARFALARTEHALGRPERALTLARSALAAYAIASPRHVDEIRAVRAFIAEE